MLLSCAPLLSRFGARFYYGRHFHCFTKSASAARFPPPFMPWHRGLHVARDDRDKVAMIGTKVNAIGDVGWSRSASARVEIDCRRVAAADDDRDAFAGGRP